MKNIIIPVFMSAVMMAGFIYFSSGLSLIVTFVPGVALALLLYLLRIYKKQPNPESILPIYLLALGIQFLHFSEEYLTSFNISFPELFNSPEYPIDVFVVFNMFAYCMFVMGAIIIYKRIKPLMIIPLFFIIYGIVGNSISHVIFSIVVQDYFPGLFTALIYFIIGPIILVRIWKETRL